MTTGSCVWLWLMTEPLMGMSFVSPNPPLTSRARIHRPSTSFTFVAAMSTGTLKSMVSVVSRSLVGVLPPLE